LKGNLQITLIEVQGHADERGKSRSNVLTPWRKLSIPDHTINGEQGQAG
jgi:outer membrane protein OmpA-like peptidoglycan-associated protein